MYLEYINISKCIYELLWFEVACIVQRMDGYSDTSWCFGVSDNVSRAVEKQDMKGFYCLSMIRLLIQDGVCKYFM